MSDKKIKPAEAVANIVSLAKRRGFVFQSSEIYGGLNGCWDYGPLGVELLKNIKEEWWKFMTYREDVEGLDAAILMHPKVWEASGHVENFTDPMIDCKQCKSRFRLDVLGDSINDKKKEKALAELKNDFKDNQEVLSKIENVIKNPGDEDPFNVLLEDEQTGKALLSKINCPTCGNANTFTDARKFNLMFKTFIGPVEDSGSVVYLRPETAQGIFINFLNVQSSARQKLPFGIAQIGKAFRNEINTKNFLFRTREFEQMEMQYFINPSEDKKWYEYWKSARLEWYKSLGMTPSKLRYHDHPVNKLAHYAKDATDIEYEFPFGWGEIEGIHNRTNFDLSQHEKFSGKSLKYFDEQTKEKFIPYIIETSAGASRGFMAFLIDAYYEEEVNGEMRSVLRFHPKLAPIKAAIFPLVNKDGMPEIAREIEKDLRRNFKVFYDDKGAVGRRYRRQDEAGTPYCITVDTQTLEDKTVTVRDRDTMQQERIAIDQLSRYLSDKLLQ
ncbi:MAG: glycine--tRNA ligase [Ignavibacteriales bacterium UTCHB2]|nr:MAG: Glycine--tRNA ligase [Ignavibacteria bacterium ADurb.Bin266]OQY73944.1 MAG: glycine--tRNA ligase [Ignavibacteriales bacterium UTCHB2]HQI40603.1 glycine--tRNA ligase [Ignavibacteriaceae bacterium]